MTERLKLATRTAITVTPRDIAKTASFALLHFVVAFTVTFALTGSITIATGVGLIEPLANTIVFYFHERLWSPPLHHS